MWKAAGRAKALRIASEAGEEAFAAWRRREGRMSDAMIAVLVRVADSSGGSRVVSREGNSGCSNGQVPVRASKRISMFCRVRSRAKGRLPSTASTTTSSILGTAIEHRNFQSPSRPQNQCKQSNFHFNPYFKHVLILLDWCTSHHSPGVQSWYRFIYLTLTLDSIYTMHV